jgi:hypothetical protein
MTLRALSWLLAVLVAAQAAPPSHDIVLRNGRVLDPTSGLDAVRDVGITGRKITALSAQPLRGRVEIDAPGSRRRAGFHRPALPRPDAGKLRLQSHGRRHDRRARGETPGGRGAGPSHPRAMNEASLAGR